MKIITEPTVRLVSAPGFTANPQYALPPHDNAAEQIIATAGKVCYDSYGVDGNPVAKHIQNLVGSGHHSVLEHVHVGLFIAGISRGCSHEIVRHRMFNYSQRSTRYTAEGDAAIVLDPYYATLYDLLGNDPGGLTTTDERYMVNAFVDSCAEAFSNYREQVNYLEGLNPLKLTGRDLRKWCRGKARQLLPHALETRMVMTGNLRAWRHFLVMRSSRHAEAEIRRLAEAVYRALLPVAPTVLADFSVEGVQGYPEFTVGTPLSALESAPPPVRVA